MTTLDFHFVIPHWAIVLAVVLGTLYTMVAMGSATLTFVELWQRRREFRRPSDGPEGSA